MSVVASTAPATWVVVTFMYNVESILFFLVPFCVYNYRKLMILRFCSINCLFHFLSQAIKNSPGCIHPLTSRVLPYIGPILNKVQFIRVISMWIMSGCTTIMKVCVSDALWWLLPAPTAAWWISSRIIGSGDYAIEGKLYLARWFLLFSFCYWFPSFQNLCGIINLYHNSIHNLLTTLCDSILQNAPIDVVKAVHDVCFDAVIWIVLQSDDHSEMQVI